MTSVTTESSWMGAFAPVALTNVLTRVADESRSGELKIVSGNWVKTVCVDDGTLRFAMSNMRQDRLGESILAHECISKNDYRAASDRMAHDGCRFGEALLKMGTLDRKQLHRELGVQVQRIAPSLFRVSEGLYSFEETDTPVTKRPGSLIRCRYHRCCRKVSAASTTADSICRRCLQRTRSFAGLLAHVHLRPEQARQPREKGAPTGERGNHRREHRARSKT